MKLTAATFDFGSGIRVGFNLLGGSSTTVKILGIVYPVPDFDTSRVTVARAQRAIYQVLGKQPSVKALSWAQFKFSGINQTNPRVVSFDFDARETHVYSEKDPINPLRIPFGPVDPSVTVRSASTLLKKRIKEEI